ncbi:MAG: hypothetical protein MZV70_48875, partial [Desulfobacterales bacterium]|nr:hypothetical protein [Desulfobacterales bacterium]
SLRQGRAVPGGEGGMTKERYYGFYSTNIYPPCSALSKRWRNFWRRRLGKEDRFVQDTHLPSLPWRRCAVPQPVRLCEHRQENGNVRISELGILAQMAASCVAGKKIFEIGTFDGRTTLNLALTAPRSCRIMTLDLPPALKTQYELASGEGRFVEKTGTAFALQEARSRPSGCHCPDLAISGGLRDIRFFRLRGDLLAGLCGWFPCLRLRPFRYGSCPETGRSGRSCHLA